MKVKERKGWKKLDNALQKWYVSAGRPSWTKQRNWLSKELVKRNFIKESQLPEMWTVFQQLTDNCSSWTFQSKILSFVTLCFDKDLGESIGELIK